MTGDRHVDPHHQPVEQAAVQGLCQCIAGVRCLPHHHMSALYNSKEETKRGGSDLRHGEGHQELLPVDDVGTLDQGLTQCMRIHAQQLCHKLNHCEETQMVVIYICVKYFVVW